MKKISMLSLLFMLILCSFVLADTFTLNASESTHSITDHWVYDSGYTPDKMYDENWNTYSYPVGFYEASVFWNYTYSGALSNASWRIKSGTYEENISLPSQCWNYPLQLKATAHFIVGEKTFWSCYTSSDSWLLVASLNPDGALISEQSLTLTNESSIPPSTCEIDCPGDNCIFYDHMTYSDSFQNCSYNMIPKSDLMPISFYDVYALYADQYYDLFMHNINYAGNYWDDVYDSYNIFWACAAGQCEPFHDDNGQVQHQLIYYGGVEDYVQYDITFYYDVSTHQISGFYLNPGNYYETFCSDCFEPYASGHKIEIYSFNNQNNQKTFYNVSSGLNEFYKENTFSIFIDGVAVAYNLPFIRNHQSGDKPIKTNYILSQQTLIYNLEISGASATAPISNIQYKENGDYCSENSDCLSQFCNFGKCDGMPGGASCSKNDNCLSGACNNGICSNPGLWNVIDSKTKSLAGNSEADLTLISIIIILFTFGLTIYIAKGEAWGFAAGGAIGLVLMFFFTFSGWMSPFVFIAAIILILGGIFYMLFSKSGG